MKYIYFYHPYSYMPEEWRLYKYCIDTQKWHTLSMNNEFINTYLIRDSEAAKFKIKENAIRYFRKQNKSKIYRFDVSKFKKLKERLR